MTLLRAAAKNFEKVTVLTNPGDYHDYLSELEQHGQVRLAFRQKMALRAFEHTAIYDQTISQYLSESGFNHFERDSLNHFERDSLRLRYGMNPHQTPALVRMQSGERLPFQVLNGSPGMINLMDALQSWPLVKELQSAFGMPAATSFKHVSPAGAAIAVPLDEAEARAFMVQGLSLSPLAVAYARARGADRMASFGDWIAASCTVDVSTANLIKREVSDGIIAPSYEPEALAILSAKKNGNYVILQVIIYISYIC